MKAVKNILTKKISEVPRYLTSMIDAKVPVMIWGAFGVGKSQIVRSVAKEQAKKLGLEYTEDWSKINSDKHYCLIDLRLSYMLPEDIKGIPIVDKENKTTSWTVNDWFPKSGHGMLFLDEFNLGDNNIQKTAYQLVNDREIAGNKISENYYICMAGNRGIEDGVKVNVMATPLLNRMGHIEILNMSEGGAKEWLQWASENNIHEDIVAFLENQPQKIWSYEKGQDGREACSPRVWEKASDLIQGCKDVTYSGELVSIMTNRAIGIEFSAFINLRGAFNIDKIIDGKEKLPNSPEKIYSIIGGVIGRLKEKPKLMPKVISIEFGDKLEFRTYLYRQVYGLTKSNIELKTEFMACIKANTSDILSFLDKLA